MCAEPATATSSEPRLAVDPEPPQPVTTSTSKTRARRASRFMEKAPFAAVSSRCLARGQYSIDQSERRWKTLLPQTDLVVRGRVDGGVDAPAEVAQLFGAEHHPTDGCLATPEDEVVRTGPRQLELGLLDQEQALDRFRQRAEPVFRRGLQLSY